MTNPLHPVPIVRQAEEDLPALAAKINSLHTGSSKQIQQGLEIRHQIGRMLAEIKKRCGHGNWLSWVKENLKFDQRQAQRYLEFAKCDSAASDLESQWQIISGHTKPLRNGAIDPEHDGSECDDPVPPPEVEPPDEEKGDAWEPPEASFQKDAEPASTSADDAGTIHRIEIAQKALKGLGVVMRALDELKLFAKFRAMIQELKDALDRKARGKK